MTEIRHIDPAATPSGDGCFECLASQPPGWWFHLRRCAACGRIGCCDSSPSQHARAHWQSSGHRYIQSFEPDEDWFWNFESDKLAAGPVLAPPREHPRDQPVPGPAGLVPDDWTERLNQ